MPRRYGPASGFYEWKSLDPKNKQPFAFDLVNGEMMAFVGLWDAWKDPANTQWLQSYTIITTDANELMAPVHDRMPVILHPGDFNRWLDRDSDHARPPIDLLRPFPADEMEAFEVSSDVGNVKNQLTRAAEQQVSSRRHTSLQAPRCLGCSEATWIRWRKRMTHLERDVAATLQFVAPRFAL